MIPHTNQIIFTHCTHPGCNTRLHVYEEWVIGLCTFHKDPDKIIPTTPPPDWDELLARIDAMLEEKPMRIMNRDA